jgi:hypothetical protein
MQHRQSGYFNRQTALLLVLFGLVVAFAFPQFDRFDDRNKVAEAYHLASASKVRLSEFYTLSARFPRTEAEIKSVTTSVFAQPAFVENIEVVSEDPEFDIVVRFYLEDDVADEKDAYLYMAASRLSSPGRGLEWRCGSNGIDVKLVPANCSG